MRSWATSICRCPLPCTAFYGGHRPGQNLYANSLVCLDAKTGERVWHYQLVHHDLWDYDLASAPVLGDITVDGKPIKAVMQITKHGFLFVFDRVTGEPVWPIEERPVPASTTPGERAWPTQPFPTKPAPFDRQGFTVDDSDRFHAGVAGGGARDRQAVRARADLYAAVGGGSGAYPGYDHPSRRGWWWELERWGVRPRDGNLLHPLPHAPLGERSRQAPPGCSSR